MRTLISLTQRVSWMNYAFWGMLLISLFLIGLRLGNLAFAAPSPVSAPMGADDQPSGGAVVNPPFQIQNYTLTNQDGALMSLKDLRGRAIVLFFGYTHCPDVCPNTLANFTLVKKSLGAEANRVAFVLVTVDSQRDTPAVLKDFLNQFDPGFIGLTGDQATLHNMAAEYGAYFSLPDNQQIEDGHQQHHEADINSDNYFVRHASPAYVIDPKGFLRIVYFNGTSPAVIADGILQMLQETSQGS